MDGCGRCGIVGMVVQSKTFRAIATLMGAVIGAGIFGIPFVVAKIGFIPGVIYLLVLGGLVLFLNLIYGEVILRTPGDHQLTGYAEIYLGKWGKSLATLAVFITAYGALLAYLIKVGEFLALIFAFPQATLFSLLFFILANAAVFFGLKSVSFLTGILVVLLLSLIGLIAILGGGKIDLTNFSGSDFSFLFLPYGVILFAFFGSSVIPEMEEILRKEPQNLKKAIVIGSLIPLLVYLLFATVVVGICGSLTSDDAIAGLVRFLPGWIVNLGAVLGVLTMSSSYLVLGYVLREVWFRDFHLSKILAFFLACLPLLILFLLGAKSFISVLSITGSLMGGLTGILIILIYLQAKNKGEREPAYSLRIPFFLIPILVFIFLLGTFSPFFI